MDPHEEVEWGRRGASVVLIDLMVPVDEPWPVVIIGSGEELRRTWTNHSPWRYPTGTDVLGWVIGTDGSAAGLPHVFTDDWEQWLVQLADEIQEAVLEDPAHWGAASPACPQHPNHPLTPALIEGRATWRCPKGTYRAPIGSLNSGRTSKGGPR